MITEWSAGLAARSGFSIWISRSELDLRNCLGGMVLEFELAPLMNLFHHNQLAKNNILLKAKKGIRLSNCYRLMVVAFHPKFRSQIHWRWSDGALNTRSLLPRNSVQPDREKKRSTISCANPVQKSPSTYANSIYQCCPSEGVHIRNQLVLENWKILITFRRIVGHYVHRTLRLSTNALNHYRRA